MASQSQVCRWLLVAIMAFLSVIPTVTAQTGTMSTLVTIATVDTTPPEISTFTTTETAETTADGTQMTTEPEDISPGSSSSQLTTLEMATGEVGDNSTSGDVGSTATREKTRTEGVSTTSGECEDCTDEPVEPGLSPGEIAGIVIGSIAGVAIIGGGIGYAIYHVKAPTKVTPTTDIEVQDMSDSPEANSDRAKLTNASDTHKDGDD
ncbi:uncharacterized protein [Diadema setosum]|uniref:uncharacterized protein n=1 Tax=Diadema setosum TaxID=31175 RepID=UPI003B3B2238